MSLEGWRPWSCSSCAWLHLLHGKVRFPMPARGVPCRLIMPTPCAALLATMGGRTRLEYSEVFYWMVDHLYDNYMDTMTDISRWSNYAQVFAESTYAISKKAPRALVL